VAALAQVEWPELWPDRRSPFRKPPPDGTSPSRPRAGGLTDQVVALGDVRGPTGGIRIRRAGGRQIAVELVQVAADRMPAVAVAEHLAQPVGLAQPRGGTEHVADRDRAAQHGGGVLVRRVVG